MAELDRILALVKEGTGVDFSLYRDSTIGRRIERRAALYSPAGLADYVRLLEQNPDEVHGLYHDLLINVTSFFRDPEVFEAIHRVAFPAILAAHPGDTPIRIWVPGCSSGQEVYSLGILLIEFLEEADRFPSIQVFGTDLADESALAQARAGRYPASIDQEVSTKRLERFFRREGDTWVVRRELRELCVFARHNVTADPPFSRIDLISCRNVLIYMSPPLQQRVLPVFHYALNPSGFLVLGSSETVSGAFSDLFELVERAPRVYRKPAAREGIRPQVDEVFFRRPVPLGPILPGKPSPSPRSAISSPPAIPPAPSPPPPTRKSWWRRFWLGKSDAAEMERFRQELIAAREFQQSLIEQQEAATEELRSANEEILSSNEELQSTNEELRTAKQELQSSNEELTVLNDQLAEQNAELSRLNTDLANLLGNLNLPVVLVDTELKVRRFTPPAAPLFHLTDRDLGKELGALELELDAPDLEAQVRRVMETGHPVERPIPETGSRWWALRIHPFRTPDEARGGALIMLLDITELRRGEEAQARLAAIVESSEDAVIGKTLDGTITNWNLGAERLYGYRAEEVIGMPISVLVPLGHLDELPGIMEKLRRGERIEPFETLRRRKDGQILTVSLAVSPIRDTSGRVIGASAAARDITASRQAAEALRLSEARKGAILQTSLDALITMDHRGDVLEFNPAAERMFGYRQPEVIGRPLAELIIPPGLRDQHVRGLAHYLETGKGPVLDRRIELNAIRADGSEFPVELSVSRISADDPPLFTGAIRDITERKRAEAALLEADRRKDEFLAVLSHELRNPLAPIRGALEIMRLRPAPEPEVRQAREVIDRQLVHLVRLVDDLLDISRITRGHIELRKETIELAAVLRTALEGARPAIEGGGHQLSIRAPDEPVYLEGDPIRLGQVLLNLLNNAAKFTPKGGRIAVTGRIAGDQVEFSVVDTGMGIPADQLDRIFEIFTQVLTSGEQPHRGLGVGLALARALVELHGGTLEARSGGVGQGSEFIVRLPRVLGRVEPPPPPASLAPRGPAGEQAGERRPQRRILVVDDNVDQARSLELLLQLRGHDVMVAFDATDALEAIKSFRPEVALLDIGLPDSSGYQLATRLRSMPDLKGLRLIAQTGWGSEEDRKRSREAGFDHHLTKPIDLPTLEDLLS